MDLTKEEQCVFNIKLGRCIGLFQIMHPDSVVTLLGFNVYRIVIVAFVLFLLGISSLFPAGLYYMSNDLNAFIYYFGCVYNHVFCCYKMIHILYYSKEIWECFDVTSSKFASYPHYDKNILYRWKRFSIRSSNTYFIIIMLPFIFWTLSPLMFQEYVITVKNLNGSYSEYKYSDLNLFLMVSDITYNNRYYTFYFIEMVVSTTYFYLSLLIDIVMILMCIAITCQLELVCNAIESLWCKCLMDNNNYYLNINDEMQLKYQNDTYYYNFKLILSDHKYVIQIIEKYYSIFRPIILTQIFVISTTNILLWFLASLSIHDEQEGYHILSIKIITLYPLFIYQLFMSCYLFGAINEKINFIVFALYSSNWTEMDMKCKKLILHAMIMNNANNLKLKFTKNYILNLEMLTKNLRFSYSIFSMLINYNANRTK